MAIHREELLPGGVQDRNAGNAGDLGKHGVYLSLLATLRRTPPWRGALDVIEAHAGKGLYLPGHDQWHTFQEIDHQEHVPLVSAQIAVLAPEPVGVGSIRGLHPDERPYAGSSVLHASVLSSSPNRSLVCYDHDANVRQTLTRVLGEPRFDSIRDQVAILDPGQQSEPVILNALQSGMYGRSHVLHPRGSGCRDRPEIGLPRWPRGLPGLGPRGPPGAAAPLRLPAVAGVLDAH
jgi:hypothetical protein